MLELYDNHLTQSSQKWLNNQLLSMLERNENIETLCNKKMFRKYRDDKNNIKI